MTDAQCAYRCGYFSNGDDLANHELSEHNACTECGNEPSGEYPVSHKSDCPRLAEVSS
jgi:hypothetical protein